MAGNVPNQHLCPDFRKFLNPSREIALNTKTGGAMAMCIVGTKLYVVKTTDRYVYELDLQDPTIVIREITVPLFECGRGIVYHPVTNTLYVASTKRPPCVFKINLADYSTEIMHVPAGHEPWGIALSRRANLLVSMLNYNHGHIVEMTTDGEVLRDISITENPSPERFFGIYHALELENGNFVVCQRTCKYIQILDPTGAIVAKTAIDAQFVELWHVDLDQLGNILVVDHQNGKLRLYDSELQHLGEISIAAEITPYTPVTPLWDERNGRLLVSGTKEHLLGLLPSE